MLLNFDMLYHKYQLTIKGVIHIGAHFGTEYNKTISSLKFLNLTKIVKEESFWLEQKYGTN